MAKVPRSANLDLTRLSLEEMPDCGMVRADDCVQGSLNCPVVGEYGPSPAPNGFCPLVELMGVEASRTLRASTT